MAVFVRARLCSAYKCTELRASLATSLVVMCEMLFPTVMDLACCNICSGSGNVGVQQDIRTIILAINCQHHVFCHLSCNLRGVNGVALDLRNHLVWLQRFGSRSCCARLLRATSWRRQWRRIISGTCDSKLVEAVVSVWPTTPNASAQCC